MQIEPYITQFGLSNIKILLFDDYVQNPQSVFNDVFDFLEIEPMLIVSDKLNKNTSLSYRIVNHKYDNPKTITDKLKKMILIAENIFFKKKYPKISEENKQLIIQSVEEDIKKMELLINRDLSHWLKI